MRKINNRLSVIGAVANWINDTDITQSLRVFTTAGVIRISKQELKDLATHRLMQKHKRKVKLLKEKLNMSIDN